jgi:3-oxoadipate CoA-transferase alpha subunit
MNPCGMEVECPMGIPVIYKTPDEAVADIPDGASVMIGGFGHAVDKPQALLRALANRNVKNLTIISNSAGAAGALGIGSIGGKPFVDEEVLIKKGQVRRSICSVPASLVISKPNAFEKLYREGKIELEYVPQGTLAERIRAGGAGLGGFYTPTGIGTLIEQGKETRIIEGRKMMFESALKADYALIRAYKADKRGNLIFKGIMRAFNAIMPQAVETAIAEVEDIVEAGELDPEVIVTPGIFIDRIVRIPGRQG